MKLFLAAVLLTFLLVETASAADPLRIEIISLEEQPGRLTLNVSAIGPDGKAIPGLTTDNFRLSMNGVALPVASVQTAGGARPTTSVLLLVDVSGSMQGDFIIQSRTALLEFVRGLDPTDPVAIMTFDSSVRLVQDFTADRAVLTRAINGLVPLGDTALYDAVLQGTQKIQEAPEGRRLVVLLSDGLATTGLDKRASSITAARDSGAGMVAIGLGAGIDKVYLSELASASGGRFLEAPTTAILRQAYADLAVTIRSQYTIAADVPPSVDRSQPGKLAVHLTSRADSVTVERTLEPLTGAAPPPLQLQVNGLVPGQRVSAPVTIDPTGLADLPLASVEYSLDSQVIHSAESAPFTYVFDPATLEPGSHTLKVAATDGRGRKGERSIPFIIPVPGESGQRSLAPLIAMPLLVAAGGLLWLILKRRRTSPAESYTSRLAPWSGREGARQQAEAWADMPAPPPPPPVEDRVLGRVVVMNEAAIRSGHLDAIMEFEIRASPLTLGSGDHCDIKVDPDEGRIAAEEARVWVQKGRLVYHKLTTLSAMATEGVTSGWVILESGEDMTLGPYRVIFQAQVEEPSAEPEELRSTAPPQEHGMRLLWNRVEEDPSLPAATDG